MDYFGYILLSVLFVHKYGKWVHEYFIARSEFKAGFFLFSLTCVWLCYNVTGCKFLFTHSSLLSVLAIGIAKTSFVIVSWINIVHACS